MMPLMKRVIPSRADGEGRNGRDEVRMTNDELKSYRPRFDLDISCFVISSTFVIRASSFIEGSLGALRQPRDDSVI